MLFGGGMLPTYYVVRQAGLLDTLWSLIIPGLINPFYVFIVRNFFEATPNELKESAFMQDASIPAMIGNSIVRIMNITLSLSSPSQNHSQSTVYHV